MSSHRDRVWLRNPLVGDRTLKGPATGTKPACAGYITIGRCTQLSTTFDHTHRDRVWLRNPLVVARTLKGPATGTKPACAGYILLIRQCTQLSTTFDHTHRDMLPDKNQFQETDYSAPALLIRHCRTTGGDIVCLGYTALLQGEAFGD